MRSDHWLAEYTSELIQLLHVLRVLVELEPAQAEPLLAICTGPTIAEDEFRGSAPAPRPTAPKRGRSHVVNPVPERTSE